MHGFILFLDQVTGCKPEQVPPGAITTTFTSRSGQWAVYCDTDNCICHCYALSLQIFLYIVR